MASLLLVIGTVNAEQPEYNQVELRNGYRYARDWYRAHTDDISKMRFELHKEKARLEDKSITQEYKAGFWFGLWYEHNGYECENSDFSLLGLELKLKKDLALIGTTEQAVCEMLGINYERYLRRCGNGG